ncbi:RNA polymerase sigma factor [Chitinophaga niabensis]|uniref:DNA-directed RNA polymerase specialized sigma subunit, sigma24 family n=1 Tax=Chitinophaga niabensis TaxID=536979 RepID=A0A1N6JT56_9BACT|nr:sigma-70 family RNA polymerase sigma factor [Chitinophaga niabensis]SIO47502.1 DNA-directed RNA polymerase specialized sigma subunit, sigma24 family [Chitinophaga niabensis]
MQRAAVYPDERILIEKIKAGDPHAKHWLYDQYAAPVYGLLLQLFPRKQDANNALVRTFVHVFKNIEEYYHSGGISLFSWIMKQARETAEAEIPYAGLTGNDISILAKSGLMQFSSTLGVECREVFNQCYCMGLSRSVVAARLGLSEQQVFLLLQQAMIAFRKFSNNN